MKKFRIKLKENIKKWNNKNPDSKQKTLKSVANYLEIFPQQLCNLSKNGSKQLDLHLNVIFVDSKIKSVAFRWKEYLTYDIKSINRLEKICKILECNIWDLIIEI